MKAKISDRLKEGMRLRNLKQVDLVQKTNINKATLSQYLSGKYEPKQNNIHLLAKTLNVSEAWLMGFDVPMERETSKKNDVTTTQLTKKEQLDFDKFMDEATYYFNDESISAEDKEKLFKSFQEVFFTALLDKKKK